MRRPEIFRREGEFKGGRTSSSLRVGWPEEVDVDGGRPSHESGAVPEVALRRKLIKRSAP